MRVYELARELNIESKEVLARAQELGIEVSTASSGLDDDSAELIRLSFEEAAEESAELPVAEPEAVAEIPEPAEEPAPVEVPSVDRVSVRTGVTAAEFASAIGVSTEAVVQALVEMGEIGGAAAPLDTDALALLGDHFDISVEVEQPPPPVETVLAAVEPAIEFEDAPEDLRSRPPVVTVMGHVDHGKTTLLDAIRRARVVEGEFGGITQHIGAYQVQRNGRRITFVDTPGHEAFTAMRARGAQVTDIVILVVAADDGVMPQTVEAINHARAAGVPIIVAINKIDLPAADSARVKADLTQQELVSEDLGGDVITVEVSATQGSGLDQLLEMVDLVAELEDFRANPDASASGVVIESNLDKGRGPVGTVIVQRGTLRVGDSLVAGPVHGRVRAMLDEDGKQVKTATPGTPVLVMGWNDVPNAGNRFEVVADDREARQLATEREDELRAETVFVPTAQERLAMLLDQLRSADEAELRLILKADAHGSLEAIREAIVKIGREGARITIIHGAVGGINENDVTLAQASEAVVVGFNVRPDGGARRLAENTGIEIRTYRVIYELLDEIEQMLLGKLAPEEVERILGSAEVRATFKVPRVGTAAGCYVTEGEITRGAKARLIRDGVVVYDGRIASLRRFKDDVRSVATGFECGIGLENFQDVKEGDVIEAYVVQEVARV